MKKKIISHFIRREEHYIKGLYALQAVWFTIHQYGNDRKTLFVYPSNILCFSPITKIIIFPCEKIFFEEIRGEQQTSHITAFLYPSIVMQITITSFYMLHCCSVLKKTSFIQFSHIKISILVVMPLLECFGARVQAMGLHVHRAYLNLTNFVNLEEQ